MSITRACFHSIPFTAQEKEYKKIKNCGNYAKKINAPKKNRNKQITILECVQESKIEICIKVSHTVHYTKKKIEIKCSKKRKIEKNVRSN